MSNKLCFIFKPNFPNNGAEGAVFFVTYLLLCLTERLFVPGEDNSGGIIHNDIHNNNNESNIPHAINL